MSTRNIPSRHGRKQQPDFEPARKSNSKAKARIRKSQWERLSDEVEKKIFVHLVTQKAGTPLVRAALQSLLVELSSVTNISVIDVGLVRQFYQRACALAGVSDPPERGRIFDTLSDISNLLGVTSKGNHSKEVLEFVESHARFPRPGESLEAGESNQPAQSEAVSLLRAKLGRLERLPENEATRFQLETEIYALEHEDEWPEVIG